MVKCVAIIFSLYLDLSCLNWKQLLLITGISKICRHISRVAMFTVKLCPHPGICQTSSYFATVVFQRHFKIHNHTYIKLLFAKSL